MKLRKFRFLSCYVKTLLYNFRDTDVDKKATVCFSIIFRSTIQQLRNEFKRKGWRESKKRRVSESSMSCQDIYSRFKPNFWNLEFRNSIHLRFFKFWSGTWTFVPTPAPHTRPKPQRLGWRFVFNHPSEWTEETHERKTSVHDDAMNVFQEGRKEGRKEGSLPITV